MNIVCKHCRKSFIRPKRSGPDPSFCDDCRNTWPKSTLFAHRNKGCHCVSEIPKVQYAHTEPSALDHMPPIRPLGIDRTFDAAFTGGAENLQTKPSLTDLQRTTTDNKVTVACPKDGLIVRAICEHFFKYAECMFEVKLDGEVKKTIHVSVNPAGWNIKCLST